MDLATRVGAAIEAAVRAAQNPGLIDTHGEHGEREAVLRRCAADKHTLARCQVTLEEMAERYGVEAGARR